VRFGDGTDKGTASNFVQILETETLEMIRQVFREESMSLTGKSKLTGTEKAREVKSKVKTTLITFL
jgi:hypothetical protein